MYINKGVGEGSAIVEAEPPYAIVVCFPVSSAVASVVVVVTVDQIVDVS